MALLPPPVHSHATKEELKESLRLWTAENGYAMTVKRSDNKKGVIEYQCNRGGSYKNSHDLTDEQRIRDAGTLRRHCPFSAKAKLRMAYGHCKFSMQTITMQLLLGR
jgi:hypothetical protein